MIRALTLLLVVLPLPGSAQSWDWQLTDPLDLSVPVEIFATDPDSVTAADVAALKARGVRTICYVSIGTVEEWRSDADRFPTQVVGNLYDDWPGERFLDIRQHDILLPLMQARFARCAAMGFDAVEPDNMDVHINDSGFPLTGADVVAYVTALAEIAHGMGLQIGQKNVPDLTPQLAGVLDFAITENCLTDGWCGDLAVYPSSGRPIFAAEYDVPRRRRDAYCAEAASMGLSLVFKTYDLDRRAAWCR